MPPALCATVPKHTNKENIVFASFDTNLKTAIYDFPFEITMLGISSYHTGCGILFPDCGQHYQKQLTIWDFVSCLLDDQLVIIMDGRDVAWATCSRSLLPSFQEHDIIFGAERSCFPAYSDCQTNPHAFPIGPTVDRKFISLSPSCQIPDGQEPGLHFLNAGFMAGRAGHLAEMYRLMKDWGWLFPHMDDQAILSCVFAQECDRLNMTLDYDGRLVVNLAHMLKESFHKTQTSFHSKIFDDREVCFLHGNGGGKDVLKFLMAGGA
jgi:hypothetical protein